MYLLDYVKEFSQALDKEKQELDKGFASNLLMTDGNLLYEDFQDYFKMESLSQPIRKCSGKVYIYQFKVEDEIFIDASMPVKLQLGGSKSLICEYIGFENFMVRLALPKFIGNGIKKAELEVQPSKMISEIKNRFADILADSVSYNSNLAVKLLEISQLAGINALDKPNVGIFEALEKSYNKEISFIWNLPGIEKEKHFARIITENIFLGKRILILSKNHRIIDQCAIESLKLLFEHNRSTEMVELNNRIEGIGESILLRVGNPWNLEVHKNWVLCLNRIIRAKYERFLKSEEFSKLLYNELRGTEFDFISVAREALLNAVSDLQMVEVLHNWLLDIHKAKENNPFLYGQYENEIMGLIEHLNAYAEDLTHIKNNKLQCARAVFTHINTAISDPMIYQGNYDMVIFLETNTLCIPQIFFGTALAKHQVICAGDFFMNLPYVAAKFGNATDSMIQKWLFKDIFDLCGIKKLFESNLYHPWMVMLTDQTVFCSDVTDFLNENLYKGHLSKGSNECSIKQESVENNLVVYQDKKQKGVTLFDLKGLPSVCNRVGDSRINIFNAYLSVQLALRLSTSNTSKTVTILVPYIKQAQFIHALLSDMNPGFEKKGIQISTIDAHQGGQSDFVIFDCVDGNRVHLAGGLLVDCFMNYGERLITQAISSARENLIILCDTNYYYRTIPFHSFLHKMIVKFGLENNTISMREMMELLEGDAVCETFRFTQFGMSSNMVSDLFRETVGDVVVFMPDSDLADEDKTIKNLSLVNKEQLTLVTESWNRNITAVSRMFGSVVNDNFIWSPLTILQGNLVLYGYPFVKNEAMNKFPVFAHFVSDSRVIKKICEVYPVLSRLLSDNDLIKMKYSKKEMQINVEDIHSNPILPLFKDSFGSKDHQRLFIGKAEEVMGLLENKCPLCGEEHKLELVMDVYKEPMISCSHCNIFKEPLR